MKWIVVAVFGLVGLSGCTAPNPSPAQIRQDTANATAEAARDSKAVAQGIVEGLRRKGPLNINRASKSDLETLPGIDSTAADRIIAGRPYNNSAQLLRRHIVTRAEYDRISSRIEAH
ncbi:MAG TPA: helix-hairpin-helix domain-containing protein [Acidobacteriaceae bacterium]|nr:helix-hairpin-helix domain-containing protein [Terriglobia bacterium]HVC89259.1 helix-hairpin-helix domain-containing protein [Acidobacteriaceae bacterium]